jgi:type I restriction enzyme S subunit
MMKAYPKYKDSGVPWLEHVPAHWEFKRSKSVFRTIDVRSAEGQEELLSVSEKNGVALRKNTNVTMFQAASYAGYKLCWPNDLVINSLWAWMTGLGFSKYHGIISTAYSVFRIWNQGKFDSDYGNYLLRSKTYNWEFRVRSKGIWRSRYQLADDSFLSMPLLIPPLNEQQQISRYLDWQTSKINKFIKAKKRLIALLKEQKQNVINQAVTRGLNPNVKFKPSGVEWIGDIPEHWEVRRIRACIENYVAGIWGDEPDKNNTNEHIVCIRVADFDMRNLSISQNKLTIRAVPQSAQKTRMLKAGDILMEKSGGGEAEPVGRVVYFDLDYPAVTSNFVTRLRPDSSVVKSRFLLFVLAILQATRRNVPSIKQTTGIQNLDERNYLSNYVGLPALEEQDAIVEHIDAKSAEIDQAIIRAQREIELMREYRTRLISDVVTGQVDVRNVKCEGGSLNEDEFEDIEEVEEEIELPEGGEDDE